MKKHALTILALCSLATLSPGKASADGDTETKLRDALRTTTEQNRSLEDELAGAQAKVAESDKAKQVLQEQIDTLTKQAGQQKPAAPAQDTVKQADYDAAVAEFNHRLTEQNDTVTKLSQTLDKWKQAYNEAAEVARTKEAARAKLDTDFKDLTQRETTCETKNAALFKVSNEILARYAASDVQDAMAAHEPFLGLKRVELQNIAQDYQDKLLDQKVTQ